MVKYSMKKILCFDLDNVICKTTLSNYKKSLPIKKNIQLINYLYDNGYIIKIFTARYMGRNDDNIQLSGATGIYNDNDFNSPIFIPNSLKNTLLIYSSTTNLFRGFQLTKMPNNVYRKAINFQFFSKRKN